MMKMKKLILLFVVFVLINNGKCNFQGVYLNTGGCPNYTPATNINVDLSTTVWTVVARSRMSGVETQLDCSRVILLLNNNDKSEISIIVRPRGTSVIHGHHGFLGFAISSRIGFYNILDVVGMRSFYLRGSVWILDTDNQTYCILVICYAQLGIGNSHVYVLTRGTAPDVMQTLVNNTLIANKLNPAGLFWGLDRNC